MADDWADLKPGTGTRKLSLGVLIFLLSLTVVLIQLKALGFSRGGYFNWESTHAYIQLGPELERQVAAINATATSPRQYRMLSPLLLSGAVFIFDQVGIAEPFFYSAIAVRVLQNMLIFWLSLMYFQKLGMGLYTGLLGVSIIAWSMSHAIYDSGLSFDTYFDLLFYLLAAILILERRILWVVPLAGLAMCNRETSALIPLMLLGLCFDFRQPWRSQKRLLVVSGVAMLASVSVFIALRMVYGLREFSAPYGIEPLLPLLLHNLSSYMAWLHMLVTLGLVPVIAVLNLGRVPVSLKRLFWLVVPIWFSLHYVFGIVAETRLFLVPQALVFVPMALWLVEKEAAE